MGKFGCFSQALLIVILMTAVHFTNGNRDNLVVNQAMNEIEDDTFDISTIQDKSLIPAIITELYSGNADNTQRTLKFIRNLNGLSQIGLGYQTLYDLMKNNHQLNTPQAKLLANDVKATQELCQYEKVSEDVKKLIGTVRDHFPPDIVLVCFRNTDYNEYMFAGGDQYAPNNEIRRVFSWRRKGEVTTQSLWTLEPANGEDIYRIKNNNHNEYLVVQANRVLCGRRRHVSTWRSKTGLTTGDTWEVKPVPGTQFSRIRNVAFNEYLYASDDAHTYNHDMRSVYTWRHRVEPVPKGGIWQIQEC